MFRDFKLGGYNLEGTQVENDRLISIILLIPIAYSFSTFSGQTIQQKGIAKYVTRPTEVQRYYKRHSHFSIGLKGLNWLDSLAFFSEQMQELISLSPHKLPTYLKGMRAASLIQSSF